MSTDYDEIYANWQDLPLQRSRVISGENMWVRELPDGNIALDNNPLDEDYRWQDLCSEGMDRNFHAMGCRLNPEKPVRPCSGFMVQVGFDSLGVRFGAIHGIAHPDEHEDGGFALYDTFDETIQAHRQKENT